MLKGEPAFLQSTRESQVQAERLFQEALALDSTYARAYAGLAGVYRYQAYAHWTPPTEGYAKAKQAGGRALGLGDPERMFALLERMGLP